MKKQIILLQIVLFCIIFGCASTSTDYSSIPPDRLRELAEQKTDEIFYKRKGHKEFNRFFEEDEQFMYISYKLKSNRTADGRIIKGGGVRYTIRKSDLRVVNKVFDK